MRWPRVFLKINLITLITLTHACMPMEDPAPYEAMLPSSSPPLRPRQEYAMTRFVGRAYFCHNLRGERLYFVPQKQVIYVMAQVPGSTSLRRKALSLGPFRLDYFERSAAPDDVLQGMRRSRARTQAWFGHAVVIQLKIDLNRGEGALSAEQIVTNPRGVIKERWSLSSPSMTLERCQQL